MEPRDFRFRAARLSGLGLFLLLGAGCALAAKHPSALTQSRQLVVVTTPGWDAVNGTLQRFERQRAGEPWTKTGGAVAIEVGKSGMGWGDGVVAVPGHAATDPVKHEGDGRSPAGVFRVGTLFGYAPDKPAGWAMPYRPLTPATECVDDRHSQRYNQIVERTAVAPDWNSSEHMRSEGVYYQWGAVIEQNPDNRPGDGSCVFLHVADESGTGTTGCTAMAKSDLEEILGWLRPDDDPVIVEMPMAEYRQAAKVLRLPLK